MEYNISYLCTQKTLYGFEAYLQSGVLPTTSWERGRNVQKLDAFTLGVVHIIDMRKVI